MQLIDSAALIYHCFGVLLVGDLMCSTQTERITADPQHLLAPLNWN